MLIKIVLTGLIAPPEVIIDTRALTYLQCVYPVCLALYSGLYTLVLHAYTVDSTQQSLYIRSLVLRSPPPPGAVFIIHPGNDRLTKSVFLDWIETGKVCNIFQR